MTASKVLQCLRTTGSHRNQQPVQGSERMNCIIVDAKPRTEKMLQNSSATQTRQTCRRLLSQVCVALASWSVPGSSTFRILTYTSTATRPGDSTYLKQYVSNTFRGIGNASRSNGISSNCAAHSSRSALRLIPGASQSLQLSESILLKQGSSNGGGGLFQATPSSCLPNGTRNGLVQGSAYAPGL